MKTKDLAQWLNISSSTVKTWSREFSDYLTPAATGGDGQYRYFGKRDAEIMAYIAKLRSQNTSWDDIHAALDELKLTDFEGLPEVEVESPTVPVPMVPEMAARTAIELEKQALTRRITTLESQVTKLEDDLTNERTEHGVTREQLTIAREELGELRGKLSTIEATAERERATWADNRRLLLRAVMVLGIVLAVAVVALLLLALQGGAV